MKLLDNALNLCALNPVLHFHQVLFSLIVFLRPSVVVPLSQSLHRACLLSVSFSLPSNHLATTTNTTIPLQASVLDGAGVDDWTGDQLFYSRYIWIAESTSYRRIGRRQESSVLLWSGLRMTVKSHLHIFLQAQTFLSLESSDCTFLSLGSDLL